VILHAHVSNEHSDDITPIERPPRHEERAATIARIDTRLGVVERSLKTWQALVIAALLGAIGSLVAVGTRLYERGERAGADAVRLDRVERAVEQLQHDLFSRRKDP